MFLAFRHFRSLAVESNDHEGLQWQYLDKLYRIDIDEFVSMVTFFRETETLTPQRICDNIQCFDLCSLLKLLGTIGYTNGYLFKVESRSIVPFRTVSEN